MLPNGHFYLTGRKDKGRDCARPCAKVSPMTIADDD